MLYAPASPIDTPSLLSALAEGSIFPVFQPIVHLETGRISSFEVLARWQDDILGSIPPSEFIPLAEGSGYIVELTDSIISQACRAASNWKGTFRLTFNISPIQFSDDAFPSFMERIIVQSGFPLSRVQIEITETAVLDDLAVAREAIVQLKRHGVRIILDDFGTGFSSLSRLRDLPFDKIKLDMSFVKGMLGDRESRKIVSAVIGLGQSLGLPVVAEGVETQAQASMLRVLGCDYAQGWLFGKPLGPETVMPLVRERGEHAYEPPPLDLSQNQKLAHLASIYESVPVGLCFLDRQLRFLSVNQRYCAFMGKPPEELIGQRLEVAFPALEARVSDDLRAILVGHEVGSRVSVLPDGVRRVALTMARATDENGDLLGISVAMMGLTERDPVETSLDG